MRQNHLSQQNRISLGAYYSPPHVVDEVFRLISKHINNPHRYLLLDNACGYGSFLRQGFARVIGADIDVQALEKAQELHPHACLMHQNGLGISNRKDYDIDQHQALILVGNPPYNDRTSQVLRKYKSDQQIVKSHFQTRDLGLSFLLAYTCLQPDFICVLHPLSYLIKEANFRALNVFTQNYSLQDALVISSREFDQTSTTSFPIVIAFYQKGRMCYEDIRHFCFRTKEGHRFCLSDWQDISHYIPKYPQKNFQGNPVAYFYTMRDLNALKRNRSFLAQDHPQAIKVSSELLPYYCYVDALKRRLKYMPYYLGNCNIFLLPEALEKYHDCFLAESKGYHPYLPIDISPPQDYSEKLDEFFAYTYGCDASCHHTMNTFR